ncbi:hypothetical protein [Pedobacter sp. L105]|uniref:hypothetical protein n=1 Tax=Pedobacter sp. L105 TaxID=1641871 RepID=UPI00131B183C|nr:hypothetical protein [Pedobacter sp. L105]
MTVAEKFILSGILEAYVRDETTKEENQLVNLTAELFPEVRAKINQLFDEIENDALKNAIEPRRSGKSLLITKIDYRMRRMAGEPVAVVPLLTESSTIEDYAEWIDRPDMVLPENYEDNFVKIISHTREMTTMIVWLTELESEVHDDIHERFLILEGSCTIVVEDEGIYNLKRGDYMEIPLHKNHDVIITSAIHCKAILQKVAA